MWTKIASLVLLWTCASAATIRDCPYDVPRDKYTHVYGKFCYRFELDKEKEYADARDYCWSTGGSLALVKSKDVNDFLATTMRDVLGYWTTAWIGLDDIDTENTFKWVDGSAMEYSNWGNSDEGPRSGIVQHQVEDCVALNTEKPNDGTWHDFRCESMWVFYNGKRRFICQYPFRIRHTPIPRTQPPTATTATSPPPNSTTTTQPATTTTPPRTTTAPPTTTTRPQTATETRNTNVTESITAATSACPQGNCDLDCGLDGFKLDPVTGCALCVCNKD